MEAIKETILIIEDDAGLMELLNERIQERGFLTANVSSAAKAFDWLENQMPTLIVLDYSLPDMNGKEFLTGLMTRFQFIPPFILATGQGDERIAVDMMKLGARDYIVKDNSFLELMPIVISNVCKEVQNENKIKHIEKALIESNQFNNQIIECAQEGIVVLDENLNYLTWNPFMEKLTGIKATELLGKNLVEVFPYLNGVGVLENVENALRGMIVPEIEFPFDFPLIQKQGWLSDSISTLRSADNKIIGVISTVRDITERKIAEKEQNKSRENFIDLFDNAPVGYHEIDTEGRIVRINQTELNMLGYTSEEQIGQFVWKNADNESSACKSTKMKLTGCKIPSKPFGRYFRRKDGSMFPASVQDVVLRDAQGNITGIRSAIYDITDRKKAEEALQLAKQSYFDIFNSVSEAIYVIDETGTFIEVNKSAERMYMLTREELIGLSPGLVAAPGLNDLDQINKFLQSVSETGVPVNFEFWAIRKNGELFLKDVIVNKGKYFEKDVLLATARDITERKLIEKELRESEEKFRSITEQISDYISISDSAGIVLYASPASKSMLQYEPDEILGHHFMEFIDPESLPLAFEIFNNGVEKRIKAVDVELKLKRKDGSTFFVELNGTNVKFENEDRILVIVHDITERKKTENALRESEDKYRTMIEYSNDLIWTLDSHGNFTFMNEMGTSTAGLVFEEWVGKSFVPLVIPEDLPMLTDVFNRTMNGENCTYELRFKRADESISTIGVNTSPIYNNGKIDGVVSFGRDITQRKMAEEALRASEELYRNLVQRIPDGVYKSTNEGKFVDVNPAMIQMLGYESKEELMSIDIKTQLYFDETDRESLVLEEMHEETGVYQLKKKDGSAIWIEDHGWYNVDEVGNILFHEGVLRDITERKLSELALQEKMDELLRFHNLTIDRELRMIELKKEINRILVSSGQPSKYKIVE